ncbi:MAG: prepilin peptidase [Arthrobacter sp.]|jgi:leader peptidase (prepilin peptidase)/N-methyltransferase|nr:prepilin peptidase [Arthrobacter sp.]
MIRLAQGYAGEGQWGPPLLLLFACCALVAVGGALAWTDARTRLLPDRLVVRLGLGVVPTLAVAALWSGEPERLVRALACGAAAGALFFCVHWLSPRSLGFGDVKLVPVLGFACGFLSWGHPVFAAVLACLMGGVWAAVLLAAGRRAAHVPLGPGLVLGCVLALAM